LDIVWRGKNDSTSIHVGQRNVGGEAVLGVDQHVLRSRLGLGQLQHFNEANALPLVVEAAPAGHAVEVAMCFNLGKAVEGVPAQGNGRVNQAPHAKIPGGRVEL